MSGLTSNSPRLCIFASHPRHQRKYNVVELDTKVSLAPLTRASSTQQPLIRLCSETDALNRVLGASKRRDVLLWIPRMAIC